MVHRFYVGITPEIIHIRLLTNAGKKPRLPKTGLFSNIYQFPWLFRTGAIAPDLWSRSSKHTRETFSRLCFVIKINSTYELYLFFPWTWLLLLICRQCPVKFNFIFTLRDLVNSPGRLHSVRNNKSLRRTANPIRAEFLRLNK